MRLEKLYEKYWMMIENNYPRTEINKVMRQILNEETSAGVGSGDVGSIGVAYANSSTAGMGGISTPQPSAFPGALNGVDWISGGGKEGSGDVAVPYNPGGANRVFHKVPGVRKVTNHGSNNRKGKKEKDKDKLKQFTKNIKKPMKTGKILNFSDFDKDQLNKVTKVKEGKTFTAARKANPKKDWDVDKKDELRRRIESHIKSLGLDYKKVGNDLEINHDDVKYNVMFRNSYIGFKKEGNKFTKEFEYTELGNIKKEISKIK
jgi:hypothetical protein